MLQGKDKNMNQDDFFENETLGTAFLFIPMDLDHETAEQKMGCETFREELIRTENVCGARPSHNGKNGIGRVQ